MINGWNVGARLYVAEYIDEAEKWLSTSMGFLVHLPTYKDGYENHVRAFRLVTVWNLTKYGVAFSDERNLYGNNCQEGPPGEENEIIMNSWCHPFFVFYPYLFLFFLSFLIEERVKRFN